LQGCAAGADTDSYGEVRDSVEVVDQAMMAGGEVRDDALVIPSEKAWLNNIGPGHVLVSAVDNGYIRRVTAVEASGDTTTLRTEEAAITDALATANIQHTYERGSGFDPSRAEAVDFGINVDFSGRTLFERDGLEVVLEKGTLAFDPTVDVNLQLGATGVKNFHAIATGIIDAELLISATVDASFAEQGEFTFTTELYRSTPQRIVNTVAGVPFVEVITATVDANVTINASGTARAEIGGHADAEINAGVVYENGRFNSVRDIEYAVQAIGPALNAEGQVTARIALVPKIQVSFYGTAGATITTDAYGEFAGRGTFNATTGEFSGNIDCDLSFGVNGDVEAELRILGIPRTFSQNLFRIDREVGCNF
jgi:hypothetical protein